MRINCMLSAAVLFCSVARAESHTITIAADDYCPYHCRDQQPGAINNITHTGFVFDVLNTVFSSHDITVVYEYRPWERGLLEVRGGRLNAVMLATRGEAAGLVLPSIEQGQAQSCFYVLTDSNWRYRDAISLASIRLGVIKGYEYVEPVGSYIKAKSNAKNIEFIAGKLQLKRLFEMVIRRRIDAIFDDAVVANYLLRQMAVNDQLKQAGCAEQKIDLFVAFSSLDAASERYAELLSDGMNDLRRNGKLKLILAKYGVRDWRQ